MQTCWDRELYWCLPLSPKNATLTLNQQIEEIRPWKREQEIGGYLNFLYIEKFEGFEALRAVTCRGLLSRAYLVIRLWSLGHFRWPVHRFILYQDRDSCHIMWPYWFSALFNSSSPTMRAQGTQPLQVRVLVRCLHFWCLRSMPLRCSHPPKL